MAHFSALIFLFLSTLTFAASSRDVTIATFNLHGFSSSSTYLKDCIQSHGGIWLIQEHWLSEHQLQHLRQLDVQYTAVSGMEDATSSGIYRGRPFGGVSICWSPDMDHVITPIVNHKHKRVVAVEVKTESENLLLISVYMPFFNSSRKEQCMAETLDAISMIDLIMLLHLHFTFYIFKPCWTK